MRFTTKRRDSVGWLQTPREQRPDPRFFELLHRQFHLVNEVRRTFRALRAKCFSIQQPVSSIQQYGIPVLALLDAVLLAVEC